MTLSRIVLRLARNPGTEFAGGDDHRGYTLTAPLTPEARLDVDAWHAAKARCAVRRFAPDEDPLEGVLARRGQNWFFDYEGEGPRTTSRSIDWAITFGLGDYVTVTDHGGRPLTYKVTEVTAV